MITRNLSTKELGNEISRLRKQRGLSQADLAKYLGLSRSAITQMEKGKRNISALELAKLTNILEFSMDKLFFVKKVQHPKKGRQKKDVQRGERDKIRVSIPQIHVEKFQNTLLYVIERCAGKPQVGKTVLNKLMYFIDFNFYELYEEHLTGAKYRKLPYGPAPVEMAEMLEKMEKQHLIQRIKTTYHGYPQTRFIPLTRADLTRMTAAEKEVIDQVIERYAHWSAKSLSEYTHCDMPWKASEDGEIIDYELVFYRTPPYSIRNYDDEKENDQQTWSFEKPLNLEKT